MAQSWPPPTPQDRPPRWSRLLVLAVVVVAVVVVLIGVWSLLYTAVLQAPTPGPGLPS